MFVIMNQNVAISTALSITTNKLNFSGFAIGASIPSPRGRTRMRNVVKRTSVLLETSSEGKNKLEPASKTYYPSTSTPASPSTTAIHASLTFSGNFLSFFCS